MDFTTARNNMIQQQVRTWNVLDEKVLQVLSSVPRENFVPKEYKKIALSDVSIPLPSGGKMFTPKEEGRLIQALKLESKDNVLQFGVGSGYLTALIASFVQSVTVCDIDAVALNSAKMCLEGFNNISFTEGCAFEMQSDKPWDVIVVTASVEKCPTKWLEWLADDGRLFVIEGDTPAMQAVVIKKHNGSYIRRNLFETTTERMKNAPEEINFKL